MCVEQLTISLLSVYGEQHQSTKTYNLALSWATGGSPDNGYRRRDNPADTS